MVELDRLLSERSDEAILKALKEIPEPEFSRLVEAVLGYLQLKVVRSKPVSGLVISECTHSPDGKRYVVLFSRRDEPLSKADIESLAGFMKKTDAPNGLVLVASSVSQAGLKLAEQSNIGVADSAKLAALLRRFDLDKELMRAAERLREQARTPSFPGLDSALAEALRTGYEALAARDFMKALDAFDKAIMLRDDYDVPWRLKGNTLDEMGYHEQALSCYKRALELLPESDETWFSLGVCLFSLGRYTEELACYERALQYNPVMQKALINKGSTLHRLGRYQEALEAFDKVLRINYRLEKVHNNRGATLHSLGRTEEALAAYTRAIELKHDYVEAWMNKGSLLYELGRFGEAFEAFTQITQLRPEMAKGWYLRGLAARKIANLSQAKASFEHALRLDPALTDAARALQEVSKSIEERFTEVPQLVQEIFSTEGPTPSPSEAPSARMPADVVSHVGEETVEELAEELYGERAQLLLLMGRHDEAFETLGSALKLEGENPSLLTLAGNVLWALGRREAAIKTFEHALVADPDYTPAMFNLMTALRDSGELERANEVSETLRKRGKSWQARTEAALHAHAVGELKMALDDLDVAITMEDLTLLHNHKGLLRLESHDLDGALETFTKNESSPLDPSEAHNNAGVALLIKGDYEKASLEFDRAIKLQRNNHAAWNNRGCVLYKYDRLREAIACFEESAVMHATSVALSNKGFSHLMMDSLAEAIQSFSESLKIAETPEAYNGKGIALERQGSLEAAAIAYKEALRISPRFKDAQDNLRRLEQKAAAPKEVPPPPAKAPPGEQVVGGRSAVAEQLPKMAEETLRGMRKPELEAMCESLGLDPRGTRAELVERLLKAKQKLVGK
ncbi:MAG: tetratricopeptide repeat protein [Thermoplasmata archaeon]